LVSVEESVLAFVEKQIHGVLHNVTRHARITPLVEREKMRTKAIYTEQQEFCEPFEILPHPNDIQCETARAVMPPLDCYESWM
jgi:hypothetical protein